MIARGLKRLALIVGTITGATAAVSIVAGLLSEASVPRALSLGWLLVGSFGFCIGAAISLRGPMRSTHRSDGLRTGMTVADPDDIRESTNVAALLIGCGLFLILLGVIADPRTSLF